MESTYPNLATFERKLCQLDTIEELHYKRLNTMLLITYNGWFYCFCCKYQSCDLNYNCGRELCPLCIILTYLSEYEEELDRNQFNLFKLKQFGFKLFPILFGCYRGSKRSLEAFSGDFCYSSRDYYTGQKNETLLREKINLQPNF